ncbi:putative fungal-specific transcription factor [Pseudomassariella vexata]|uniref:Putative fungal-specific transcription factor n=1 Tax=Pseudomassariella vexata TaxID=1141098 RepID=A0A1Y2EFW1_9PEZI|nr:putative fungal-specific transcription factor [Pseudomassariella vexata]ORY70146.1 putative fungal-specific transcription factor [Pseudomassariella vexata]
MPEFSSSIAPDAKVRDFVSSFYAISDDPTKNEEWVDHFMADSTLVMGNDAVRGVEEIRKLREKMWEKVVARKHSPGKVFEGSFPSSGHTNAFMLSGDLEYKLKTGETQNVSWAAYADVCEVDGRLKLKHYRVWIQR